MRPLSIIAIGVAALIALPSIGAAHEQTSHGTKIYPYKSHANYCPEGLQPVSISGVICCGKPNQHISYQAALATKSVKRRSSSRAHCPVGQKGCTFN